MSKETTRPVVVSTAHRGIFVGYTSDSGDGDGDGDGDGYSSDTHIDIVEIETMSGDIASLIREHIGSELERLAA